VQTNAGSAIWIVCAWKQVGGGKVIAGFDAAVTGLEVGSTRTQRVPPEQAYGMLLGFAQPYPLEERHQPCALFHVWHFTAHVWGSFVAATINADDCRVMRSIGPLQASVTQRRSFQCRKIMRQRGLKQVHRWGDLQCSKLHPAVSNTPSCLLAMRAGSGMLDLHPPTVGRREPGANTDCRWGSATG
jgi:FKBP-type peptidyl-prolyl cis-trans isomerase